MWVPRDKTKFKIISAFVLQWVLGEKESEHEPTIAQAVDVEQQLGSS